LSIYGEERKIKFVKNGTTIPIDYCVILRSEPEPKTILHESIINRHREWIDIYDHWIVECIAYLCKYADPNAAYENFLQYEGDLIDELYDYIDGSPFYDENFEAIEFRLDKIKPRYIKTDEYPDELRFTFRSQKTVIDHIYKIIEEPFDNNTYDENLWSIRNGNDDFFTSQFTAQNERLKGSFGCCFDLATGVLDVHYHVYQFYLTKLSKANTDIDVRGEVWKANTSGNRSSAIGIWALQNQYALIACDNVYANDGEISLLIRNGNITKDNFTYKFSTGLSATVKNKFRITYTRNDNAIKFYYLNGSTWTQLGSTQTIDFGDLNFRVGAFQGVFNSLTGGDVYNDSLKVIYIPDDE
jgi:hypothetical protein